MPNLKDLREQIEAIDASIIEKLAERSAVVKKIGALKAAEHLPILDATREQELFQAYEKLCQTYQLAPDFVRQLFELIHANARELQ